MKNFQVIQKGRPHLKPTFVVFLLIAFVGLAFSSHHEENQTQEQASGKNKPKAAVYFNTFGESALSIAGSEQGWIYKIGTNGRLYRSLSSKEKWQQMSYAKTNLKKVTVVGETPYVLDDNQNIFRFANLRFTAIPGKARDIQGTDDGQLYAISRRSWLPSGTSGDETTGVYRWDVSNRRWRKVSRNGITVAQFGAAGPSIMYTDRSMKMYTITPIGQGTWPGLARSIAGNSGKELFVVGSSRRLFKWNQSSKNWEVLPGTPNDLQEVAVAGEMAFVRNTNGKVFQLGARPYGSNPFLSRITRQAASKSLKAPAAGMQPTGKKKTYPVVTILWDPHHPDGVSLDRRRAEQIMFSANRSVSKYMREVSNEQVSLRNVGILGPYDSQLPYTSYWATEEDHTDAWKNPHHRRYMEAVTMADRHFDFAKYDTNKDGVLAPTELSIVLMVPGDREGGWVRDINLTEIPQRPLYVDGVKCTRIADISVRANTVNASNTTAHEMMHLLFHAKDMYWSCKFPQAAGGFSLMDQHWPGNHIDPFHKLKLGWLDFEVAESDGLYFLDATTAGHRNSALILMNPKRSMKEYFILEVRKKEKMDQNLQDEGLAIWRVVENASKHKNLEKPRGVDNACFQREIGLYGRGAVQLIQPVFTAGDRPSFSTALWDGTDPRTGYDIPAVNRNPDRVSLNWADGTPSGIEIKNISKAGRTMYFYVKFPTDW